MNCQHRRKMAEEKSSEIAATTIEGLSVEIMFIILDHLKDDPLSLKSFSLVSKSFYAIESRHRKTLMPLLPELLPRLLRRYSSLSHLDLSLCTQPNSSLLQITSEWSSLRSINLSRSRSISSTGLSRLVLGCANLVEIDVSNVTGMTDAMAAAVAGATRLERLKMERCKAVTDVGIGCIAVGCRRLKVVSLKWCLRVTDMGVSLIALKCKELQWLDLSYVPITEKCLPPILRLQDLEELVLVGCLGIDDDGLAMLRHGSNSLKALDLSKCQNISHSGLLSIIKGSGHLNQISLAYGPGVTFDIVKCLENFSSLQSLKLDGCVITSSAMKTIGNWSASLKELSLIKCSGVTDEGISFIVKKHREIRKLDITCCRKITSLSIDSITSCCTNLISLKMEACSLVSKDAFVLVGQRCRFLEELDVTDDDLDDEGLSSISRRSRLSILKLGICLKITDEGLCQIGMHCARLKEIDLYRAMGITDIGIASIAKGCPALELINFAYCDKVTDASLMSLSKCLRLKALEIRGCPCITSEGLYAIAAGCKKLSVLDIKKCFKINDSGMMWLARYSQNLKQINLSYCSVTDVGLLALASMSHLQNMTLLHLAGLSPNGLAAALLACRGLRKVKLHLAFKSLLPLSILYHLEGRGCVFHWRDKPFQPQVRNDPNDWNLQI